MNFANLKILGRAYTPGAKTTAIDNTSFELILNEGAADVAQRLQCMKNYGYFDAVANQERYVLSQVLDRFICFTESGLWYLNGSQYEELDPETTRSMDNKFKNWRGDSADIPERYAVYGPYLIPNPKPSANLTNAFLAYYAETPITMSADSHFPFHIPGDNTVERSDLAFLSDLVLMYAEWKVLKALNKRDDAYAKLNEYLQEIENKRPLIELRPDIVSHDMTKMMGPRVGR